jgi:hypothetical protein
MMTPKRFTVMKLERVKGIEPSYDGWEPSALPLSYTRKISRSGNESVQR